MLLPFHDYKKLGLNETLEMNTNLFAIYFKIINKYTIIYLDCLT